MQLGQFKMIGCAVAAALAGIIASAATAAAQSPAEFYKGQRAPLLVSHPAGGAATIPTRDSTAGTRAADAGKSERRRAEHAGGGRHRDDQLSVLQAPKDGSVIGLGAGPLATATMMGSAGARYEARQLSWIGSMNAEAATAIAWHTHPVKTAKDLETTELVIAAGGATDISAISPIALNRLLGLKIKTVTGYPGSAGQVLALERGEVGGIGGYNYGVAEIGDGRTG